jgi:hypothetical protein
VRLSGSWVPCANPRAAISGLGLLFRSPVLISPATLYLRLAAELGYRMRLAAAIGSGWRGVRVIAQGVETAEDLEFLWEHDCDEGQGNFSAGLSRPIS